MSDLKSWLDDFSAAMRVGDAPKLAGLFQPHGMWRDLLALTWTIATFEGREAIAAMAAERAGPTGWIGATTDAPQGASEGFISFATKNGTGKGYVRLEGGKCLTLLTALDDLAGHEFPVGMRRASGFVDNLEAGNWRDQLEREAAELGRTRDPYVLIIGAGQAGLGLGAALRLLGVPTLLVDRHPRVGDQWRSRYKSLTLHDPVWYDHMPFLPFPDHWPVFTPKDKMGDWLELYAGAMELDVWTETECVSASHDSASGRWDVTLRCRGEEVLLHAAHVVMAVGNAGFPRVPEFAGADLFKGPQLHSSMHKGSEGLEGKRLVVIGANNSALDIAQDGVLHGADVTMIQRSSTHIVRQSTLCDALLKPVYSEEALAAGITTEKADLLSASVPIRLQEHLARQTWAKLREVEKDFYEPIEQAGFAIDFGEDGTGIGMKYLRAAAGYYIDVGACEMIVDGRIKVRSGHTVDRLTETGVMLDDGTEIAADVIVYATGFGSMEQWVARLIGQETADRIGRCWGYGSGTARDPGPWEGELRNMWKPTAQEGLWFMGGNLAQVRFYARYLALQLKARHAGLDAEPYVAAPRVSEPA